GAASGRAVCLETTKTTLENNFFLRTNLEQGRWRRSRYAKRPRLFLKVVLVVSISCEPSAAGARPHAPRLNAPCGGIRICRPITILYAFLGFEGGGGYLEQKRPLRGIQPRQKRCLHASSLYNALCPSTTIIPKKNLRRNKKSTWILPGFLARHPALQPDRQSGRVRGLWMGRLAAA
ncbi:MAG: hypothetical protein II649_01025, partial [Kiritimatiellae bacterium]|nr:hypothetical protein [Kiritimatiellia bacterium]